MVKERGRPAGAATEPVKKWEPFVNGEEGCVRETRKGVLHEDDPHFSELFEALKNAEGHALRHGPGENAEEKGHLC